MVVWLCGLSGSGKTTLGRLIYSRVKQKVSNIVLLDGEDVRAVMGDNLGHDLESRRRNSVRIASLCQLLDGQGIHVICCAMTLAPEAQAANRSHIKQYYEVFLDVSVQVLASRDPKGIYRRALAGELKDVSGVDIPYVPPAHPHLVLDNNVQREDLAPLVNRILELAPLEYA
jgi:adenylylsulfate kinase-like enzyme